MELGAEGGGGVAVAAAGGSDVLATTEFGGLFRIGSTVESLGHVSRHASHLYRDRDGVIWVGSRDALWRVDDNNTAKEISRPDSGKDEHAPIFAPIHAIARDRSGSLWVHVASKGTFRLTGNRWSAVGSGPWDRVIMSMGNDTDGRCGSAMCSWRKPRGMATKS
jgi:ligand-binding sensor domain-containing protein